MANYIDRVMNPTWYHGHGKSAPFFEGWYFKCVSKDEQQRWSFIPGVFLHKDSRDTHAFIQVLDGMNGKAYYHRFPVFEAKKDTFDVKIALNRFTEQSISLNIDDEIGKITGELKFSALNPWQVTATSPGVMGWFGWLPFLECYHGVVSFDHTIEGNLNIYGQEVSFTGGRGYIEKDWGQSFPTGYIWQQSNHFDTVGTCLTASIATIPNLGRTFPGFIVGLWHDGQLYRFTTYNGSTVDRLVVTDSHVEWVLYNNDYELRLSSTRAEGGLLKGPEREAMHKRVDETMKAEITTELYRLNGTRKQLIFSETGRCGALEVVGNLELLLKS